MKASSSHMEARMLSQTEQSPQSPESLPDSLLSGLSGGMPIANRTEEPLILAQPASERVFLNTVPAHATAISSIDDGLDFSNLDLFCPINADEITTRWMNPYIPIPGQKVKQYSPGVSVFIFRTLKSYAAIAVGGRRIPPFIHPLQISAQSAGSALTACLSLVRICENPLPGSEATAMMVIRREMESLMEYHASYDDISLLAAFQAYLIYCLILFFRLNHEPNSDLRSAVINLQTLAHISSKDGLMCVADQHRTRPRWEEWIVTETKRRALYVTYLFDSILSTQEEIPTFLATELRGLPAGSSKSLWQAQSRSGWEGEYNIHLSEWTEQSLAIDELWPLPTDMEEPEIAKRRGRVDHWLEDIDEFGTMLYAVTVCTHGG
ncbi:hypothetical protein N7478_006612 [Penicillium angulare]|uniref:uncharacterized protein n=1 Tax=Penicillium angulare TaxID=116970 RepID=UPI0025410BAD|nr:uncharacterized protein N7478_006612 [Penicillium angulare]KAJ5281240.1 hypothetical protein N7478_006612 [Penicillium angulare]